MPGAAEPAKSRAQPGSLDLLEADPADHPRQHRESHTRGALVLRRLMRDSPAKLCG